MKKSLLTILFFLFVCIPSTSNASYDSAESGLDYVTRLPHTQFLPSNASTQDTDIGISITFVSPIPAISAGPNLDHNFQYADPSNSYAASVAGVLVTFKNNTDDLMVLKLGQSNISLGSLSAIPFVDGMKYKDAGNPSATPDVILPPQKSIRKTIYADYYHLDDTDWIVDGVPVLKDNSLYATLYLKVESSDGKSQFVTIQTPNIGIPQHTATTNSHYDASSYPSGVYKYSK